MTQESYFVYSCVIDIYWKKHRTTWCVSDFHNITRILQGTHSLGRKKKFAFNLGDFFFSYFFGHFFFTLLTIFRSACMHYYKQILNILFFFSILWFICIHKFRTLFSKNLVYRNFVFSILRKCITYTVIFWPSKFFKSSAGFTRVYTLFIIKKTLYI